MVTPEFARTISGVFGERGVQWLRELPALLSEYAQRWNLTLESPFDLSYSYVAPARQADGRAVVVKAGVPGPGLTREAEALRFYLGRGAVQLLRADPNRGVLLLERLQPGLPVLTVTDEDQSTRIAAAVMQCLWRPAPSAGPFPSVAEWAAGLGRLRARYAGGSGPLPERLVRMAETLFADLLQSSGPPVLLHGDLHHWNILSRGPDGWAAIDPKGVTGEPAYEAGAWLRNPFPALLREPDRARRLTRRGDVLVEALGLDRQRLVNWAKAQAVLSAWWALEDNEAQWEPWLDCAELLSTLR